MKWPWNKAVIKKLPKTFYNTLEIRFTDYIQQWSIRSETDKLTITPWIPFYKWYFGRTSDEYIMISKNKRQLIKRSDIKDFSIYMVIQ